MKFVLVNHRTPLGSSACLHCSRPLGVGYLREISTQRPYCDHDCYRRDATSRLSLPRLSRARPAHEPLVHNPVSLVPLMSLGAVACWGYAIAGLSSLLPWLDCTRMWCSLNLSVAAPLLDLRTDQTNWRPIEVPVARLD